MLRYPLIPLIIIFTFFSSCTVFTPVEVTPSPGTNFDLTPSDDVQETQTEMPQASATASAVTLRLWVPPQFDPNSDSSAGRQLQRRLDAFTNRRPGVHVEVRVKSLDGEGDMLGSLAAANAAAPLALPDLVALPRYKMEEAALNGLLYPMDDYIDSAEDMDWYPYAEELAYIQGDLYGLPIAGDAQVMVYRPSVLPEAPQSWIETIERGANLLFPAADPQALMTLTMYQANGGVVMDEDDGAFLNPDILNEVLAYYAEAEQAGVMPYWITQYQADDQIWEEFLENRTNQAVTWASNYLSSPQEDVLMAPLPTPDGNPFTLASGWVWALTTPPAADQQLSIELADFLTEGSFLGQWSGSLGYLPVRPGALAAGPDPSQKEIIELIVLSAVLFPPSEIMQSLGLPLQEATVAVLKQQIDPLTAAQSAASSLAGP